jgi:hypothetical protein
LLFIDKAGSFQVMYNLRNLDSSKSLITLKKLQAH